MAEQTILYGYIETISNADDLNKDVLSNFRFNIGYSIPNIFSTPVKGYQGSIVSFGGSYKNFSDDKDKWFSDFERLLMRLYAKSAIVNIENELDGELLSISYVVGVPSEDIVTNKQPPKKWKKWFKEQNSNEIVEQEVVA